MTNRMEDIKEETAALDAEKGTANIPEIRVNCGASAHYTDSDGNVWLQDQPYTKGSWGYIAGHVWSSDKDVENSREGVLYQTKRYDRDLMYVFDTVPNGNYTVRLHFTELFHSQPGQRILNITLNHETVLSNYDIVVESGPMTAAVKQFNVRISEGRLEIQVTANKTEGILNAIEILPSTQRFIPPVTSSVPDKALVSEGQSLELHSVDNTTIHYTVDGSDPRTSHTRKTYHSSILLEGDMAIKAYATAEGGSDSNVTEFTFRFVPFLPPADDSGPSGREKMNLTGNGWKLWLDKNAPWKNDTLYLPKDVYLPGMPVNPPSVGWEHMYAFKGMDISVPASVEEYSGNGVNTYTYHGVSWFWRTVDIPGHWAGKTVKIHIGKVRLRAEIYVNEQLAGYDLVSDTPFAFDISSYVKYGQRNTIAIRITNPGGTRGWEDYWLVRWGSYILPSGQDFGGIGGEVTLAATNTTYIGDVFVKNLLPAKGRNIEVITTVHNRRNRDVSLELAIRIYPHDNKTAVYTGTFQTTAGAYKPSLAGYSATEFTAQLTVPDAELWDIETPQLYDVEVTIKNSEGIDDAVSAVFGFRTFEVKEVEGKHNLYFNGKRIRHRSAIDWNYYAPGGNYATEETARKSVLAAKDIGHNGINCHRRIGEPLVFKYADAMGLYMYEEPGGFHIHQGEDMTSSPFAVGIMKEKITRMVIRDRNHPSLIWYCLCNEDNDDENEARMWALNKIARLDGTRMIGNSSQDDNIRLGHIKHIRPYETEIRIDFYDLHTIENKARFDDDLVFGLNNTTDDARIRYWGESGCFTGPSNWYLVGESQKHLPAGSTLYDLNIYKPLHDKIAEYFADHDLIDTGSRVIQSPADVSVQAARGLMYADGRIGQATMVWDSEDGFAINGWTNGPMLPDEWDSSLCDEGRNLKGPASDYAYWVRELQIAILRKNGKYFNTGDSAQFSVHLINEGKLPAGTYTLQIKVKEGNGSYASYLTERVVRVEGGDTYAQLLIDTLPVTMGSGWKGGYITVEGRLYDSRSQEVASGAEQVLLRNRSSYKNDIDQLTGAVYAWPAAKVAITGAGVKAEDYEESLAVLDYITAGDVPDSARQDDMLRRVQEEGSVLMIKFDERWASSLHDKGILSQAVTEWGGKQTGSWKGNGWGYIDYFIGDQALPSKSTISTNNWEVPGDPYGFYPFKSTYPTNAYGAYMARHGDFKVLIGSITYGKGKILLVPTYPVDEEHAFNDMLFYNVIRMSCQK